MFRHERDTGTGFGVSRIEATDPAGGTESSLVPTGFTASNAYLDRYNSIYWDKQAMAQYPGDLTKGVIINWMMKDDVGGWHPTSRNIPHSIKRSLENRVWYRYQDQSSTSHHLLSWGRSPSVVGRVLDGGGSRITQATYNTKGYVTSLIDPVGRQTTYTYASNGIDLLQVDQVRSGGTDALQVLGSYNSQHLPATITDAAGEDTTLTYNVAGQPLTVTNA
ncbi:MAG: RHS repeat domain-containing protein, partial [Vicinamibacterales bacterium]